MSDDAVYKWITLPDKPNVWTRSCWGGERFFHQYSRWTKGHADAIGIATFQALGINSSVIKALAEPAAIAARWVGPLLGASVELGVHPDLDPWLGAWVYTTSNDSSEAENWARDSTRFYECKPGQPLEQRVEEVRGERTLDAATSARPCTLHWIFGPGDTHALIAHGTHYIYDGQSNLSHVELIMAFLARHVKSGSAESGLQEIRAYKWGTETSRLPRCLPECIGISPSDSDDAQSEKILGPELAGHGPSLGLPPQRMEPRGEMGYAFNERRRLPTDVTAGFNRACRSLGFTSGHGLDAARHVAVWAVRAADAKAAGEDIENTHIINFMLPVDYRRYFKKEFLGQPYICTGTAGFTTEISLDHIRAKESEAEGSDAHLDRAFKEVGPLLAQQYRAVADDRELIKGMRPVTEMLGVDNEEFPPFEAINPGDAYTSLGKLESRMRVNYSQDGSTQAPDVIRLLDWFNTSRLTRPQMGLHTWVWKGSITLNVNWSDHYDAQYIKRYVDTVEGIIRRMAAAYGTEKPAGGATVTTSSGASLSNLGGRPGQVLAPRLRKPCTCQQHLRARL
ncbi:hypothetical protein CBOM_04651 [Ceraceosorus bombacis]|uniref:Uncharacterized protein n=1 Tax=Ceraceosorus bombacis TaxID=401625 RepID=A0A0P1BPQ3_9BASI|nr:hypothetical protein CBOM_04651 [Ceraceosorus bombacis]